MPAKLKYWPDHLVANSPQEIKNFYEQGYTGVLPDPEGEERLYGELNYKTFEDVAHHNLMVNDGKGKLSAPFLTVLKVNPLEYKDGTPAQRTGCCFVKNTKVKTLTDDLNGKIIDYPIQDICVGWRVLTHNDNWKTVTKTYSRLYTGKLVTIICHGLQVTCTQDHKFLKQNNSWTEAQHLNLGDLIQSYFSDHEIKSVKITSIVYTECTNIPVFCLEVEDDHSFIANEFVVHNCVSRSTVNAFTLSYAYEVWNGIKDQTHGVAEEWPSVKYPDQQTFSHEIVYGERGWRGQGANCSTLAAAVKNHVGLLPRGKYTVPGYGVFDCTRYDDNLAAKSGPHWPQALRDFANKRRVRDVTNVRTIEGARDALANNYGLSVCSGYATSSRRPSITDSKGNECAAAGSWRGSWSHAMEWCAVDDREWAHRKYGGPMFLVQNSWGKWNSGPRRIYDTDIYIPHGSFWITPQDAAKMLRGGGGWVISNILGFPRRGLNFDFF